MNRECEVYINKNDVVYSTWMLTIRTSFIEDITLLINEFGYNGSKVMAFRSARKIADQLNLVITKVSTG